MATNEVIFLAIGAAMGLLALWILYRALFKDRARGRRRCPKCWYDLSGTPGSLTCSECGHTAKRERSLFRTRRKRRWALVGLILAAMAWFAAQWPSIQRDGVESTLPTTVLIAIAPWLDHSTLTSGGGVAFGAGAPILTFGPGGTVVQNPAATPLPNFSQRCAIELHERAVSDKLAGWQWRWLFKNLSSQPAWPPWTLTAEAAKRPDAPESAYVQYRVVCSGCPWLSTSTLRFRIESGAGDRIAETVRYGSGDGQPATTSRDPWGDPTCVYRLPDGLAKLKPRMIVERRTGREGEDRSWVLLWDQATMPTRVAPVRAAHMNERIDPQLTEHVRSFMTVFVNEDGIGIRWSRSDNLQELQLPTLAMDFELLHDGKAVASTSAWWTSERLAARPRLQRIGPIAVPGFYEVLWEVLDKSRLQSPESGVWEVRVRSNGELAKRDLDSAECWSGTFTIPVFWNQASQQWISE